MGTLKILTSELSTKVWARDRPLINRISFEERSAQVALAAPEGRSASGLTFVSNGRSEKAQANVESIRLRHPALKQVELFLADPLATAAAISEAVAGEDLRDALIDVSSFRREELLMLLEVLRTTKPERRKGCDLVYVSAGKMSDPLSGNVTQCRSVVGFAGEIWPSRPTRLVVLMGFEIPRARAIIEAYEPRYLVLGMGRESESMSKELFERNKAFFQELKSNYDNVENTFEFSAREPLSVAAELTEALSKGAQSNVVLAPLHTKLSTIGVGLYAQAHREVQVCYAEVGAYNEETYSTTGGDSYVFSLSELFGEA